MNGTTKQAGVGNRLPYPRPFVIMMVLTIMPMGATPVTAGPAGCEGAPMEIVNCLLNDFDPAEYACVGGFPAPSDADVDPSNGIQLYSGRHGDGQWIGIMVADGGSGISVWNGRHTSFVFFGGVTSPDPCGGMFFRGYSGNVDGYWLGALEAEDIAELVCGQQCG